jgi:hypothetical protein
MVAKVELIVLLLVVRAPVVILATPELVVLLGGLFRANHRAVIKRGHQI